MGFNHWHIPSETIVEEGSGPDTILYINVATEQFSTPSLVEVLKEKFTSKPDETPKLKIKRPEFFNGVRVRISEDYDFSTRGLEWKDYDKDFVW
jgi:CRISPR/Cas system-associated protein Cas10 (large subunit of type III CRISPR-Cas system)